MNARLAAALVATAWLFVAPVQAASDATEFPHRAFFPDTPVMSTADLRAQLGSVTVIDVRSHYEYETLHIKNAVNVPLSDKLFEESVAKLQARSERPMVFYCNGRTCKKSYDATRRALRAKIGAVYVYDAGIFEWAQNHPDQTVLLGKSPIKVTDLIDPVRFQAHLLAPKDFQAKVGASAIVLDVRDRQQRDSAVFPFQEERARLDEKAKLDAVIRRAKAENKTLLVYDKVGHQVQWFQYYLESKGLRDYYFLNGGSEGFFQATLGVKANLQ
jgi:rhodanese-related sulfurtransferase